MSGLFVPGWGVDPCLYRPVLPRDWAVLEPPSFRATKGSIARYVDWLSTELDRRRAPVALGGHSFGAALAVLVAAAGYHPVERLVLVGPAGLPLEKPLRASMAEFGRQLCAGWFPVVAAARSVTQTLVAPHRAVQLAWAVQGLDLRPELERLRLRGIPCLVVVASTDSLTTPRHCRRIARFLGAEYHELAVSGGHVWFLRAPALHRRQLAS
jgi:pimeloyl-ACP methyl ester carboxylesterase